MFPTLLAHLRTARRSYSSLLAIATLCAASSTAQESAIDDEALREALATFQAKVANNDVAGAISDLESVREGRSDSPEQLDAILGALYAEVGRFQEAFQLLSPLADRNDANPAVLYNAGRAAMELGDLPSADSYLTRAVRIAPTSPASRQLGLLRGSLGQTADSYALLRQWVAQNPTDREARIAAAAGAVQLRRPLEAEALLTELPQQDEGVRFLWGQTLLQKGDPYGAIGFLEGLLVDAPEIMQSDVRGTLAEAYNVIGESAKAVEILEGRVEGDARMSLNLAVAQYRSGELSTALETLRPFAERVLNDAAFRRELGQRSSGNIALEYGRMLLNEGRAEDAALYLEAAVAARPDARTAWQSLGQALAATGDREKAQQALERFQQLASGSDSSELAEQDLDDPTGKVLREAMDRLRSEPEAALSQLRAEAAIAPNDPRPRLFEARALLLVGQAAESLAVAQELVASLSGAGPLEADAHYLVGSAHIALDATEAAEASLRRALTISPEHTGAMNDLAVVLMSKEDNSEAERLLRRVLQLRPDDPVAADNLRRLTGEG